MGARPSSFKKGGGYLNEVDATIVGYTWLVGEESEIKKGSRKGESFTPLSLVPEFQVDGEDETKTQRLLLGDASAYGEVTDDDQVLQTPDGQGIGARSEVGIFIQSLVDGGFPEELFSDDPESIDYRPMIGTRVRLVQEVNQEKTKRQGQQKGKDGKLYDRKDLKVATVHALPEAKPAKGAKGAKPAAAASKVAPAKGKGKQAEPEVDVAELAGETIREILGEQKDNTIAVSKVSMAVLKKLNKDPNRDDVREWLIDSDNYENIEGVTYNAKKGTLTLDE